MSEKGFVLITGKSAAAELFGSSLPWCGVVTAGSASVVDCPCCAVIVGEGGELPHVKCAAGVIISGDSTDLLPTERLEGIQLITCGRCGKNTVCVTSNSGEKLTLALNRGVTTLCGVCEPVEQPVNRPPEASEYDCMAAFAAAVLLGEFN
ncbi:MAG: hypothetical protein ACI4WS_02910 [Oscillospiraceae bacterium]